MKKRLLISAGGTGGHIYPAIALAKALGSEVDILFIGGLLSSNTYFQGSGIPFKTISCGPLSMQKPMASMANVGNILKGMWECRQVFQEFNPDLLVGFGSYHTFPVMAYAWLAKIPYILHASDSIPGKVIRLFSKHAIATSIHFPKTSQYLKGPAVRVKMPLREGFRLGSFTKKEARSYFGLNEKDPVVLIFGGSQGAASLNAVALETLSTYSKNIQVIHIIGKGADCKAFHDKYFSAGIQASVKEFEPRMELAWHAADAVISRAGASTIAEQIEFEVPGIYVPFPRASENHQELNARHMTNTIGCSQMILESKLSQEELKRSLSNILGDQDRLREKIKVYKNLHQPINLADLVIEQLHKRS